MTMPAIQVVKDPTDAADVATPVTRMSLAGLSALHEQMHRHLLELVSEPRDIPQAMLRYLCTFVAAGPQPFPPELISDLTTRKSNTRHETERVRRLGEAELTLDRRILVMEALIREVGACPLADEPQPDPAAEPAFTQV